MIPKIIHYCWFGKSEMPENEKKYVEGWRNILPDYEIVRWDENNFDVNQFVWTKEAYISKKWAFVSDFVRLYALYHQGGIYLDTDVEVRKSFDSLLNTKVFFAFGPNYGKCLGTHCIGASRNNSFIKELLNYYDERHFILDNSILDLKPNPRIITEIAVKYDLMIVDTKQLLGNGVMIYPSDYFPSYAVITSDIAYAIHHQSASWMSPWQRKKLRIILFAIRFPILKQAYKVYSKLKIKLKSLL